MKLKPCPFCGGEGLICRRESWDPSVLFCKTVCRRCGCGTAEMQGDTAAAAMWNQRATKPRRKAAA